MSDGLGEGSLVLVGRGSSVTVGSGDCVSVGGAVGTVTGEGTVEPFV